MEYNRSIEGRGEHSTRFADGRKGSALTVGQLVRTISRWSARKSADEEKEKAAIKEVRQKESMSEVGQSTIDDGSKS
jgi:hypothetical protein